MSVVEASRVTGPVASYLREPRHWPLALGLLLVRLLTVLPLAWQRALGRLVGRVTQRVSRRREVVAVNLRWCFPELSDSERRNLSRAQFEALGIGLFETALAWWASDSRLQRIVDIEGLPHLEQALASGHGVLLLTGHFSALELGARFITRYCRFHAMYRPHGNPFYQAVMRRARERRSGLSAIVQDDIRSTVRALRRGEVVWYAPDQNYGRQSVFAPFFGIPALTITATARLVQMSGALVLPYFPQRLPDGRYRLTILPPLADFPSADPTADAARINALLEDWIRRVPEQYFWVHRRFKSRPAGEVAPY